jgi:hypothetical protein
LYSLWFPPHHIALGFPLYIASLFRDRRVTGEH